MKTGRTLQSLAAEIESQRDRKKDFVASTTALTVVPTGNASMPVAIETKLGQFPIRDLALGQMAEHTKIPMIYTRRLAAEHPELLATNLNTLLHAKPADRLIRTLDGNDRAFLSNAYQRIDNVDVANVAMEALLDSGAGHLEMRSCEVTESRLYLKASFPNITREVKSKRVGDLVEAGVMITNSEVGLGAVSVTPFAFFLVCTNGMVRDKAKRWAHLGGRVSADEMAYLSDDTIKAGDRFDLGRIRDAVKHAMSVPVFDKWIERLEETTAQAIPAANVSDAIEVLGEKLIFTQTERKSVLTHLIEGGDLSRYGLMNAVTRSAQDSESYDRATELEAAGQRVIDLPANDWRQIAEAA